MSVPGVYVNPNIKPCSGSYSWIPIVPPNIGSLSAVTGFNNLIIDNGKFRNYYVPIKGQPNIKISTGIGATWISGNPYSPIINSSRPLNIEVGTVKSRSNNFVAQPVGSTDLIILEDLNRSFSGNIASIYVEYDLSLWIGDINIERYFIDQSSNSTLSDTQLAILKEMQSQGSVNNSTLSSFLVNLYPSAIIIVGVLQNGDEIEFPFWEDTGTFDNTVTRLKNGLGLTRLRNEEQESDNEFIKSSSSSPAVGPFFNKKNIKYIDEIRDRNKFKLLDKIIFRVRPQFLNSSLSLVLKKVMIYTADRVNFNKQLPCDAIGYSMFLNGKYYPALGASGSENAFIWPQDSRRTRPNVHIKLFSPEYKTNSPGFAHSLNVHVIILTFPIFLFLPLFPSLAGILAGLELAAVLSPHFGVIIGPAPFTKQFVFYGTSLVRSKLETQKFSDSRTAVLPSVGYKQNTGRVVLLQDNNSVFEKSIESYLSKIIKKTNFYNDYEYAAVGLRTDSDFQNQYFDRFGIETRSSLYNGSPLRTDQYLQAFDLIPSGKLDKKTYSYQSYVFLSEGGPNINELFNSEPCLIFKCNFEGTSTMFQEPGLLSASINCYVTDVLGLFDTKLAYRIYAVNNSSNNIDPRKNIKSTFKITNDTEESPGLIVTNFDGLWEFDNVLISANIKDSLQAISSDIIINSTDQQFTITTDYEIYCAIYAFSVLNDQFRLYDISKLGSLDFPVINFSIVDNFVLSMPIFYKKSYSNGGDLQAQKDFGYQGKYTKDENIYTLYNRYFTGQQFSNDEPYANILNSDTGYDDLLIFTDQDDPQNVPTKIELFISAGSKSNPSVTYVDFVVLTDDLSRAKINIGEWLTELSISSDVPKSFHIKYEIDVINSNTSSLVCKIINSEYSKLDVSEGVFNLTANITVPFYLPGNQFILLFRLYVRNEGEASDLVIDKIAFKSNTIEYFSFKGSTQSTGIRNLITYYEDLPIQPTRYVGNCKTFFVKFDIPTEGFVIYAPADGMFINGVIYSPTWIASLPSGLELDYRGVVNSSLIPRASGVQPYQIFFRTGTGNVVKTIDTKKHKATGLIVTLVNDQTNFSDNAVRQIVSESYARFFRNQNYLTTVKFNDNIVELEILNPIMASGDQGEGILIEGQVENFDSISTLAYNLESPGSFAKQPQPPNQLLPSDLQSYQRVKLSCCSFVSVDYKDNKTYSVGATSDGCLLYAEDALIAQNTNTQIILIDGVLSDSNCLSGVSTGNNLLGKVAVKYPGIFVNKNVVIVFYVYENQPSKIYSRVVDKGIISDPIIVFDFGEYLTLRSSSAPKNLTINQISVAHNDVYPYDTEFYLAFDCSNKIFFLTGTVDQSTPSCVGISLNNLAMIYGSRLSNNEFTTAINQLIDIDELIILSFSPEQNTALYSSDLQSSQRVGLVDFDGFYIGVQFIRDDKIIEVVFDKSFLIFAELREIGTISI